MTVSYLSSGSGHEAVVFLHGVGSGKEGWRAQEETVCSRGWRFIAVDAPGFGTSPLPDAPGFGPHVESLLEVVEKEQIKRLVICGHSLGGMTAQEFYAAHPERVSGLVLSATSPAFGKADGDFQKAFLKARFEPFDNGMSMPEFARNFVGNLLGPDADDNHRQAVVDVMETVSVDAYRLSMRTITGFDQRANLPNIAVPTLLISGEHDTNSPAKMMARMAQHIPRAQYVELPGTGHMAPIESPSAFNHHLTTFLESLPT